MFHLTAVFYRHTFFDQYVGCFYLTIRLSQQGAGLWFVFVHICSWSMDERCPVIGCKSTEAWKLPFALFCDLRED